MLDARNIVEIPRYKQKYHDTYNDYIFPPTLLLSHAIGYICLIFFDI